MKETSVTQLVFQILCDAQDWMTKREIAERVALVMKVKHRPNMKVKHRPNTDVISNSLVTLERQGRVAVVRKCRPHLFCAGSTDGCDSYTIRVRRYPPHAYDFYTFGEQSEQP